MEQVTELEWTPSTHHQVPQPAGHLCAAWYEAIQPPAVKILYALAHTKGEVDSMHSLNAELVAALENIAENSNESNEWDAVDKLRANEQTARKALARATGQ